MLHHFALCGYTNDIDIYNLHTSMVHMKQSSVGGTTRFHHSRTHTTKYYTTMYANMSRHEYLHQKNNNAY